jgi:hypothetical protein
MDDRRKKNWKVFGKKRSSPNWVLSRNLPGGSEENNENHKSGWPRSQSRFEPSTSQIRT